MTTMMMMMMIKVDIDAQHECSCSPLALSQEGVRVHEWHVTTVLWAVYIIFLIVLEEAQCMRRSSRAARRNHKHHHKQQAKCTKIITSSVHRPQKRVHTNRQQQGQIARRHTWNTLWCVCVVLYLYQELWLDAMLGVQCGCKLPEHIYETPAYSLALLFRVFLTLQHGCAESWCNAVVLTVL